MVSFEIKMWWAIIVTGLIFIGLAVAAKARNWWIVTALSGFALAGLYAVMMESMWWIAS